jgi:hypothetical protein
MKKQLIQRFKSKKLQKSQSQHNNLSNNQLFKSAAALSELVALDGLNQDEVQSQLASAAEAAGLPPKEIDKTIASGSAKGSKNPRRVPEPPGPKIVVTPGQRIIVKASEIKQRNVSWLWAGRIPLGKLTTFAGNGGSSTVNGLAYSAGFATPTGVAPM